MGGSYLIQDVMWCVEVMVEGVGVRDNGAKA
jgi:hypothetical protein